MDPREAIKAAMAKSAFSRHTKEQIADHLMKSADRLFDSRSELREDGEMLAKAYDDATGIVTQGMYGDPQVKSTRDLIRNLDHQIGETARQMEYLARFLRKK